MKKRRNVFKIVAKRNRLFMTILIAAVIYLVISLMLTVFEPDIKTYGQGLWISFQILSTIGFGDYTVTTSIGRVCSVLLYLYTVGATAVVTSVIISYHNTLLEVERDDSVTLFVDQLERLPELSKEELTELSKKIKRLRKRNPLPFNSPQCKGPSTGKSLENGPKSAR